MLINRGINELVKDSSIEDEWRDAIAKSDSVNKSARTIEGKINALLTDPAKKVSKQVGAEITNYVSGLSKIITNLLSRNAYLKGIVDAEEKQNRRMKRELDKI